MACIKKTDDIYLDNSDVSELDRLRVERKFLQQRIYKLERENRKIEKKLIQTERALDLEKVLNNVLRHYVEKETNLYIPDFIDERKDSIHLYERRKGDLPIIVHKNLQIIYDNDTNHDSQPSTVSTKQVSTQDQPITTHTATHITTHIATPAQEPMKKEVYRAIKGVNLVLEQDPEEVQHRVEAKDDEIKDIVDTIFEPVNIEECYEEIDKIFEKLSTSRVYTKLLERIKKMRYNTLRWLDLKEYELLVQKHLRIVRSIIQAKKYNNAAKERKIIQDAFTPLELRLVSFGKYYETIIEAEDIDKIKISLEACTQFPKEYVPYESSMTKMQNYSLLLFTVDKCIEYYIINRYGFHNIVYIEMPKSQESDPYSFYHLERVDDNKRCWCLDSRLEGLAQEIHSSLLTYAMNLFRKIYRDAYGDYTYRPEFWEMYPIAEYELIQLLENILVMGSIPDLIDKLRVMIRERATMAPTDIDKINLKTEESGQKTRLKNMRKDYSKVCIIQKLFTNMSDDDAIELINHFNL